MANKVSANLTIQTNFQDRVQSKGAGVSRNDVNVQKASKVYQPSTHRSKEEGDLPDLHDNLFNFIPGSCFEIGSSIALLQNPGQAGEVIDRSAQRLAQVMETVFSHEIGLTPFSQGGVSKTLREWFKEKLVDRCSPGPDLGRCRDGSFNGWPWLQKQLNLSSQSYAYTADNMLCKITIFCAFGELLKALAEGGGDVQVLASLFNQNKDEFQGRIGQISKQIKHAGFDNKEARARTERAPLIDNRSVNGLTPPIVPRDGKTHRIGSGEVYVGEDFHDGKNNHSSSFHDPSHEPLRRRYLELEKQYGRNSLPRQGQPIRDQRRPGMLSEETFLRMPESFKEAGLPKLLKENSYEHGSGINRWFIKGTYARQSWEHDLPAAGAHSNTTVEGFIALNCLGETSLFGDRDAALSAGLMIASFMNFGGYHSFVETFPIAQAIAKNEVFQVQVGPKQKQSLYKQMIRAAQNYASESMEAIQKFEKAYTATIPKQLPTRPSQQKTPQAAPDSSSKLGTLAAKTGAYLRSWTSVFSKNQPEPQDPSPPPIPEERIDIAALQARSLQIKEMPSVKRALEAKPDLQLPDLRPKVSLQIPLPPQPTPAPLEKKPEITLQLQDPVEPFTIWDEETLTDSEPTPLSPSVNSIPVKPIERPATPSLPNLVYPPEIEANLEFLRANPSGFWLVQEGRLQVGSLSDRIASVWNSFLVLIGLREPGPKPKDLIFDIYIFLAAQAELGLSEVGKRQVRNDLFQILGKLPSDQFDRKMISSFVEDFLIEGLPPSGFDDSIGPQNLKRIQRIQLALTLGVSPKVNGKGKHGTLILFNCQGEEEAVFKPSERTAPSFLSKKGLSFRRQREIVRESKKISSSQADRAAFLLDEHFQFGLTPLTLKVKLKGEKGTLMFWEHGAVLAKDFNTKDFNQKEINRFQMFAIYDYLLGNLDRHSENWLIKTKNGRLKKIVAIDNTHSFPYEHVTNSPLDHLLRRNHYAWGKHPLAKFPLTDEVRLKMKEITNEEIIAFVNKVEGEFAGREHFFTKERAGLLFRRAAVLRTLADQANATPALLSSVFSEEETVKVLSGSSPSRSNS